ncbi:MAG: carboxypeptidase-like regulatory domain-containing protein [Gemmatimonadaceae bacterium]
MITWRILPPLVLVVAQLAPLVAAAQTNASPVTAHVSGVVFDSLARRPLVGADVHIRRIALPNDEGATEERTVVSDERGAFSFDDVALGDYVLGFFHASSDSLGVIMPMRRVDVRSNRPLRVNLAVPSQAGLIALVCGRDAVSDSSALIIGYVRDATTRAPDAISVVALQWAELVIGKGGVRQETKRISTPSRNDGWYAFCNVPVDNLMELRVARGADTSGAIAADLVGRQLVRRDLYIGSTTRITLDDTTSVKLGAIPGEQAITWRGPAQLVGRVRASDGRPLAGARVSIVGSDVTTLTSDSGRFVLTGLPSGSQTLNARALGFLPIHATVHLLTAGAQNVADVSLTSLKSFLDTIRVTATRLYTDDANGFESRKRSGQGHYIDRAIIDRRQAIQASNLLQMIPRLEVLTSATGLFGHIVVMKTEFTSQGYCRPDLYVDGVLFRSGDMEIDEVLNPDQIEGIEVYTKPALAPVQFTNNMSGCGSIVVWRRKTAESARKRK